MTMTVKKVCITGDLARMFRGTEYALNSRRIFHVLRRATHSGTGLPVVLLANFSGEPYAVHAAMDKHDRPSSQRWDDAGFDDIHQHWIETYHAEPTERLLALFASLYADSLVVGYELSPLMKKAFSRLSVPYIDIIAHPVRYLPQFILGFSSENSEVGKKLAAQALPTENFFLEADFQKARYLPNTFYNHIPDNTLILFGQKPVDKVLIAQSGDVYSMVDYVEQIDDLISRHSQTCFAPHPRGSTPELLEYFRKKKNVLILPHPDFPKLNTYMYLSSDAVATVAGLNSSVLVEGHFFGKAVRNFAPFEYNYFHDHMVDYPCEQAVSYPLPAETYLGPAFWHEIASCLLPLAPQDFPKPMFQSLPNLRLIFRGGGGSFDDAQSYTQCCKIGDLETRVSALENSETEKDEGLQIKELKCRLNELQKTNESLKQVIAGPIMYPDVELMPDFANLTRSGAAIQKLLTEYTFDTVLDIGAGSMQHANIFAKYGKNVTALDFYFSDDCTEENISDSHPGIIKKSGDFNKIDIENSFGDKRFDCIWVSHCLEHQSNVSEFLARINHLLKEGGILAITVPPLKHQIVSGHISLWNAGLILYRLILAGFDCKNASVLSYEYNISVIITKKTITLPDDISFNEGDLRSLRKFFPENIRFTTRNKNDEAFDGDIHNINW